MHGCISESGAGDFPSFKMGEEGKSFGQRHAVCKRCAGHSECPRAVALLSLSDGGVNSGSKKACDVFKIITQRWWS